MEKCHKVPKQHCTEVPHKKPKEIIKTVKEKNCKNVGYGYGQPPSYGYGR